MMESFNRFFQDKTVLVTGHTGFKGGWLAVWLQMLGARVVGFALPPPAEELTLFHTAQVENGMVSVLGDVRDYNAVAEVFNRHQPEVVFHLAAQPLVRRSFKEPVKTYGTNVMGTVHLFEAVRVTPSVKSVVNVTSDKCYANRGCVHAYRENDPVGGSDPYSSSKGCAELVSAAYLDSYFSGQESARLASGRAGNVIGGGDWAEDRIVPDCMRALADNSPVRVRNPGHVRPWQHVLEPLSGYLWLAVSLCRNRERYAGPWNFGPPPTAFHSVGELVESILKVWGSGTWNDESQGDGQSAQESQRLMLDCTKAAVELKWRPVLSVSEAVRDTVAWYHRYYTEAGFDAREFTQEQIRAYTATAAKQGLKWAGTAGDN